MGAAEPLDAVIDSFGLGHPACPFKSTPRASTAGDPHSFRPIQHRGKTDSGYVLRFKVAPQGCQLLFRIKRFTSDCTRELIAASGKTVTRHGGFDQITCKPYQGKPL